MAKKKRKHAAHGIKLYSLRPLAIAITGMALLGLALVAHAAPAKHTEAKPYVVAVTSPAPKQQTQPTTTKTAAPTVPPTPTTSPAPTKSTVATPVAHTTIPQGNKREPVVTPSPSSSVSSLAPITPPTTSSSGGGSSTTTAAAPTTATGYTSTNWSGYMATSGTFKAIAGSWVVPSNITGTNGETTADSAWIGIGGVTSNDLIQVGTQDTVSASGRVSSSAFYELLPNSSTTIPNVTITPGDSLTAAITEVSSSQWTITITDKTDNETFSINTAYSSTNSSAEWIEEDPSYSFNRQILFDNFHSVTFGSGTTATSSGNVSITSSSAQPVTMLDRSGSVVATPSPLSGGSFSVTRN
jgi:hypothetical protein